HCLDVAGQAADRPELAVLARLAVTRLIEGDDTIIRRKNINLMLPILAVAAPAVQEDEGGIPFAADLADDAQPILGTDRFPVRLGVPLIPERGRHQEREAGHRKEQSTQPWSSVHKHLQ